MITITFSSRIAKPRNTLLIELIHALKHNTEISKKSTDPFLFSFLLFRVSLDKRG